MLRIILFSIFVSAPAFAQTKPKVETLDFGNELIQGDAEKPDFLYLLQKKEFNLNRLIKLRENFLPEMRNTSEVINTK